MRIVLDHAASLRVQVQGQAFMFADAPPQAAHPDRQWRRRAATGATRGMDGGRNAGAAKSAGGPVSTTCVSPSRAGHARRTSALRPTSATWRRPSTTSECRSNLEGGARRSDAICFTSVAASRPLRILYAAIDQTVPGTLGGSVHVRAVAEGLAAMGNEVHALVTRDGRRAWPAGPVRWRAVEAHRRATAVPSAGHARGHAAHPRRRPDVVIERYHNFGGEGILCRARRRARRPCSRVNAPVVDYPGSLKVARRPRAARPADAAAGANACRARRPDRHAERRDPARWRRAARILEIEWGADTERSFPARRGAVPFAGPSAIVGGLRRRVPRLARRDSSGRGDRGSCARAGDSDSAPCSIGDGPERRRVRAGGGGTRPSRLHRARCRTSGCRRPRRRRHRRGAVRLGAHPPLALGFYWSPLKIFEYMAIGAARSSRRPFRGFRRSSRRHAKACSTTRDDRTRWPTRWRRCATPTRAMRWAPRRASAPCATTAGGALPRARALRVGAP